MTDTSPPLPPPPPPLPPPPAPAGPAKPPLWRRRWVLVTAAVVLVLLVIGALSPPKDDKDDVATKTPDTAAATAAPTPTAAVTVASSAAPATTAKPRPVMPSVVGARLDQARARLEGLGLKVHATAPSATFGVVDETGWVVTTQTPAAGTAYSPKQTVELVVDRPAGPSTTPAPQYPISAGTAQTACDREGDAEFPYGFKAKWILGKIAERWEGDHWFLKVDVEITNMYGAERKTVVECSVAGTDAAPQVTGFLVYP